MKKQPIINAWRLMPMIVIPLIAAVLCLLQLYNLQIVHGVDYFEQSSHNIVMTESVPASRGGIYDRYGRLLVGNRVSQNVVLKREQLVDSGDPDGYILKLIEYANERGIIYNDESPLAKSAPFGVLGDINLSVTQQQRLKAYMSHFWLDPDERGFNFFRWLKDKHYKLSENYSDEQARQIVGVRYELELRTLFNYAPYYFAEDVGAELIVLLQEQSFPGVSVVTTSVREYHTKYAAHILGRVGKMNDNELSRFRELGYPMNALVGKDGLEAAFEADLHGSDGVMVVTRNENNTVTDMFYSKEPKPGNNVRLTIDIDMQQVVEQELARTVETVNEKRQADALKDGVVLLPGQLAQGAAAVVVDVRNGDVLASASYPTFDLSRFNEDYATLIADTAGPLYNRAIQGTYEPGSTFKPITALAALNENVISSGTAVYDGGKFTKYDTYQPSCALYPYGSHGTINVMEALTVSCNYFFYDIGDKVGVDNLAKYTREFGFGEKTGIELSTFEKEGNVASQEYKRSVLGEAWVPGDTLQVSIGQSFNLFTPIQMASYTATLANSGKRYGLHFLKEVKTHDNTLVVQTYEPYVAHTAEIEERHFLPIYQGMVGVTSRIGDNLGTARSDFLGYDVKVAAKTGTVQFNDALGNNAVFIAYAPADNPEIAIAIVVEKGGAGSSVGSVAKTIFDYYFASTRGLSNVDGDGVLLK